MVGNSIFFIVSNFISLVHTILLHLAYPPVCLFHSAVLISLLLGLLSCIAPKLFKEPVYELYTDLFRQLFSLFT